MYLKCSLTDNGNDLLLLLWLHALITQDYVDALVVDLPKWIQWMCDTYSAHRSVVFVPWRRRVPWWCCWPRGTARTTSGRFVWSLNIYVKCDTLCDLKVLHGNTLEGCECTLTLRLRWVWLNLLQLIHHDWLSSAQIIIHFDGRAAVLLLHLRIGVGVVAELQKMLHDGVLVVCWVGGVHHDGAFVFFTLVGRFESHDLHEQVRSFPLDVIQVEVELLDLTRQGQQLGLHVGVGFDELIIGEFGFVPLHREGLKLVPLQVHHVAIRFVQSSHLVEWFLLLVFGVVVVAVHDLLHQLDVVIPNAVQ